MIRLAIPALCLLLTSCVATNVPDEIQYSEIVSVYSIGCEEPYKLTIGCGKAFLANVPLEIGGRLVMVAATQDGSVLIITNRYRREIVDLPQVLTLGIFDSSANHLGKAVKELSLELAKKDINVKDVKVLRNVSDLWGYIVITDGDALSSLGIRPAT